MSGVVGPRLSTIPPTFFNDYSFEFDGISEYAQPSTQTSTENTSFSCWIKTTETFVYTDSRCAFGGRASVNGGNYTLGRLGSAFSSPNDMKVRCFNTLGTTKLNDDMWHHIVFTHDFTTKETKAYVDGNLEVTVTFPVNSNLFNVAIGWNGFASSTFFEGSIDECAWFTSVLTPSDINTIYGTGIPNDISSLNPKAWYRMGDNSLYKSPQWLLPSNENKDKVSNYSMSFDGTDDYMSTSVSSLNSTTTFTISFWGKKTSTTKTVGLNDKVTDTNKFLLYWWSNGTVYLGARNGASNSSATFALSYDSDWHHFMGVYVGGTSLRLYVDGVLRDTITSSVPATLSSVMGNNITIGYVDNTSYTTGNIDEVAIWNSDQSANVSTISSNPLNDLTSLNPIVYYKMGENATFKDPQWLIPNNENKDKISNYSMSFDGTDDGVTMAADSTLAPDGAISISLWVKGTSSSNCHLYSRQFVYLQHTGVNKLRMRVFQTAGIFQTVETGTVNIYDGAWHHILATYSVGGNAHIYLDGVLKTNPAATITGFLGGSISIGVGTNYLGNGSFYSGQIDEFAYWHNQDVSADIDTIYNGGAPQSLSTFTPSVWLRMGDDATYNFSTSGWTMTNNGTTGIYDAESINMDINDRVGEAPGSSENTVSYNMDINDRVGDAPNSENNALSYNMVLSGRTSDVPT